MYSYDRFLKILLETEGIPNALNNVLKYDFIYHSNKIERSTFTIEAIQLLIEKKIVKGTHTLNDIQETINSYYTFDLVIDSLNEKLSLQMIKEWHERLMYRTRTYDLQLAGVFREFEKMRYGTNDIRVRILNIEDKLISLINDYYSLENVTIEDLARFHLKFKNIHPFQHGDGKIARFIFLKQLLENKLPLKYMNGDNSLFYKRSLNKFRNGNLETLVDYLNSQKDFIEENKQLLER